MVVCARKERSWSPRANLLAETWNPRGLMELRQKSWTKHEWHEVMRKAGAVERILYIGGVFKPGVIV